MNVIVGLFTDRKDADNAIHNLKDHGFNPENVSVLVKDEAELKGTTSHAGSKIAGGAAAGITTGAVFGGIAGLLVGIGAIAIPGIGAFLVGGPIAAALGLTGAAATTATGAATGALAGGLIGALTGLGIPKDKAEIYERRLKEGAILLAVSATHDQQTEAKAILERNNATDIAEIRGARSFETGAEQTKHSYYHAA